MRKLLIVVDMQKDFVDGTLGTAEAVKEKIDQMHIKNIFKLQLMPCFEYKN